MSDELKPVAWMYSTANPAYFAFYIERQPSIVEKFGRTETPLYARPTPQEAQGLVERLNACPDVTHARIALVPREPEYLVPASLIADTAALITTQAADLARLRGLLDEAGEALDRIENYAPSVQHGWSVGVRDIARRALARIRSQNDG